MQYCLSDAQFCKSKSGGNLLGAKVLIQMRNYSVLLQTSSSGDGGNSIDL